MQFLQLSKSGDCDGLSLTLLLLFVQINGLHEDK